MGCVYSNLWPLWLCHRWWVQPFSVHLHCNYYVVLVPVFAALFALWHFCSLPYSLLYIMSVGMKNLAACIEKLICLSLCWLFLQDLYTTAYKCSLHVNWMSCFSKLMCYREVYVMTKLVACTVSHVLLLSNWPLGLMHNKGSYVNPSVYVVTSFHLTASAS